MLRFVYVLTFCLVTACGGDDAPPGGISGDGCEECGAFEGVLESICGGIDRCPDFVYPIGYRSQGECVAILAWATTCQINDDAQDIDEAAPETFERRIPEVSEEEAQACADYINAASCDELNALMRGRAEDTPCSGLGNVENALGGSAGESGGGSDQGNAEQPTDLPEGNVCEDSVYCADGLFCRPPDTLIEGTFTEACSTCDTLPELGEVCGDMDRHLSFGCVEGLRCIEDGDKYVCATLAENGQLCEENRDCQSDFCWREGAAEEWSCREGGGDGDACDPRGGCQDDFVCIMDGENPATCSPLRGKGEPCEWNAECDRYDCSETNNRCGVALGDSCMIYSSTCQEGFCETTTATCVLPKEEGEPCTDDEGCVSGHCSVSQQVCLPPRCEDDTDCVDGEFCSPFQSTCVGLVSDGGGCEEDAQCLSSYCRADDTCGQPPQPGDACSEFEDCFPTTWCDNGTCAPLKDPGEACTGYTSCKPPFICQKGQCERINISCVPAKVGESCASLRVCEADATCDLAGGVVCKPRGDVGDACRRSKDCVLESYCDGGQCRARPIEGELCDGEDLPCAPGHYCIYDESSSGGQCEKAPWGQPCGDGDDEQACPEPYSCGSRDYCLPQLELGDECGGIDKGGCPPPLFCGFAEPRVCTSPGKLGDPCGSDTGPCEEHLFCGEENTCAARIEPGELCQGDTCVEGYFCKRDGIYRNDPSYCVEKIENGEPCDGFGCKSGHCGKSGFCIDSEMCVEPEEV